MIRSSSDVFAKDPGLTSPSKGTKICPRPSKEGMRGKAVIVAVSVWMGVAGCSSGEGPGDGGSCALVVDFEGRTYEGHGVQVAPEEGSPLGTAVLPACNDTDGAEESPEDIEVARLPGVPQRDAILWRGRTDTVLLRTGLRDIPKEVARLEQAAPCDSGIVPVTLKGPWLGILGADEKTELDLLPPYDLSLFVEESSARRYDRAFLDIRVPSEAGKLLTREDIKKSLWEGGSIEVVVAGCDGRRFLAEDATAFAP
jgi:hypothetical protein